MVSSVRVLARTRPLYGAEGTLILRALGATLGEEFWCITDADAYRIDVISASGLSRFCREPGEDISTTLNKIAPGGDWHESSYEPEKYFPRKSRSQREG